MKQLANNERPKLFVVPQLNVMSLVSTPTQLKIVGSTPPRRPTNISVRSREHLLPEEIDAMRLAVRSNRYGIRDEALIVIAYRHACRVAELVKIRWTDIDEVRGTITIHRVKRGPVTTHYMDADELALIKQLPRVSDYVFLSERGKRISERTVHDIVANAGRAADLPLSVHPHMLRHARGFVLANRGTDTRLIQEYFGHREIKSTMIYTAVVATRFDGCQSG